MKRLAVILLCSTSLLLLSACTNNSTSQPNDNSIQQTTQATNSSCYYYDIKNNTFTNQVLITLNIPQDFTATNIEELLYKDPIYYIGEFKNSTNSISVFQYNNNLDFTKYTAIGEDWVIDTSENKNIKIFYKNINDTIVGITISNLDDSELTTSDAIEKLSYLTGATLTVPEEKEDTNITVEGSLSNPAKLDEWVSTYIYNKDSKKYELVLISITNVYKDNKNASKIEKYNNWLTTKNEAQKWIKNTDDTNNIIFEYSVFYPSSYTTSNGKVSDMSIPITLVNSSDTSTTINGVMNLYKSIKFFNELYEVSATAGEEFTEGVGTYKMSSDYMNYLIKIDSGNGDPKYFTIK